MSTSSTPAASIALIEKFTFVSPPPKAKSGTISTSADGVITIPNETGTLVTTGSSAVVTGTMIGLDTVAEANMANDAIGQDQLKSVVTLQILDSGGTVVKTMFGAGA